MKNLGELLINGRSINLDTTNIEELEKILKDVQEKKCKLKDDLDNILEEIYC